MALPVESQGVLENAGIPVLFTGIGKINAAHVMTRKLAEYRFKGHPAPHVVNFGTAGSRTYRTGALVACRSFIQRDMDVTGLGFERGITPFDPTPAVIEFPPTFTELPQASCSTGDSFETTSNPVAGDVLDMEAYALAKVCLLEQTRFSCVKYVTDGADHAAAADWQANLSSAAAEFLRAYQSLVG
jgi:adenosylhomocysteine nucleosidase